MKKKKKTHGDSLRDKTPSNHVVIITAMPISKKSN